MSTQLPTVEQGQEAFAFMGQQVYAPAFFEKLASLGIEPGTEKEAEQLLQIAATLRQHMPVKQASDENEFLSHALHRLQPPQKQADLSTLVKRSADSLVQQDALTKAAALTYAHVMTGGELAQ